MTVFAGTRTDRGCVVTADGAPLAPCNDLMNHSPGGFEWGYGGSGPAQLALAICAHVLGAEKALKAYQAFKWAFITPIREDSWTLPSSEVEAWADKHLRRDAQ